jgi:hypothetical protein
MAPPLIASKLVSDVRCMELPDEAMGRRVPKVDDE